MSLRGKNVIITRQNEGIQELTDLLELYDANVIPFPLISFSYNEPVELLSSMKSWDIDTWVIITSQNALPSFDSVWKKSRKTEEQPFKIATVGDKTKYYIEQKGYEVSFVPSQFVAKYLISELSEKITDENVVYLHGNLANEKIFQEAFSSYESYIVYETHVLKENAKRIHQYVEQNSVDFFVFTSPSAVRTFFEAGELKCAVSSAKFVAIGPSTKLVLQQFGISNIIMPKIYTLDEMVKEMNLEESKHE